MPTTYACDECHNTSTTLDNWFMVGVQLLREDPNAPKPPGGRTLQSMLPDYIFDTEACRAAWLGRAGIAYVGPAVEVTDA